MPCSSHEPTPISDISCAKKAISIHKMSKISLLWSPPPHTLPPLERFAPSLWPLVDKVLATPLPLASLRAQEIKRGNRELVLMPVHITYPSNDIQCAKQAILIHEISKISLPWDLPLLGRFAPSLTPPPPPVKNPGYASVYMNEQKIIISLHNLVNQFNLYFVN